MTGYLAAYAVVGILVLVSMGVFVGAITANRLVAPAAPHASKLATYECGVDPVGEGWAQTQVRYYVYAYLYVVFAVDAVYLFPWATVFAAPGFGAATLVEMFVFLGFLAVGLLYAWRKGVSWRGDRTGDLDDGRRTCPLPRVRPAAPARARADAAGPELGPPLQPVGLQLRAGLLRDRVHRRRRWPGTTSSGSASSRSRPARGRPT